MYNNLKIPLYFSSFVSSSDQLSSAELILRRKGIVEESLGELKNFICRESSDSLGEVVYVTLYPFRLYIGPENWFDWR